MNIVIIIFKCCLLIFILCRICHLKENCIRITRSEPNNKTGVLRSQTNETYPNNLRCYYYFEALPDERVELNFTVFDVNGVPPRCLHDFIDIYTVLDSLNESLLDVPSQGRYCGKDKENLPYLIISVKNIALVDFHTDSSGDGKGFELIYRFFSDAIYRVGTKLQQYLCGFLISDLKQGTILSPTYPGIYPDHITCFYKFQGEVGERIKLTFNDIDLYSGGNYCPFDHITIYDGPNNEAHVIDTICGSRKVPIAFYSNGNFLQVRFKTTTGRKIFTVGESDETPSQLRGFNASFEIGTRFVDLNRVTEGENLPGTECDRIIRSNSQSSGIITSPYYPDPSPRDIVCHYDINGLVDKQNLEKVQLFIEDIDIGDDYVEEYVENVAGRGVDMAGIAATTVVVVASGSSGGTAGKNVMRFNRSKCQNGALQAYTTKASQKILAVYKMEQHEQSTSKVSFPVPDYQFCGTSGNGKLRSYNITSDSPKMLLIFDTFGARPGRGFKVRYQFSTDYAIPGTAVSGELPCHFKYMSTSAIQGTFNSPRHPSNYPVNTYCVYEFHGQTDEIVRLTFENFQVEDDANCSKDFVKIFKMLPPKSEAETLQQQQQQQQNSEFVAVGHYCGERFPGPQDEDSQVMRVTLNSDGHNVYKGFRARYEFVKRQPPDKKCFYNITNVGGGVINSPNYPHKYTTNKTCEWIVYGRFRANKILLTFDIFSIEGNPNEKIGCGNAVLKIYTTSRSNMPTYELCGDNETIDNLQITTKSNVLRLKFVSTAKATGGKGFRLPWTEILPMKGGKCPGFLCEKSGHCIPNDMKCNGVANCGKNDRSDELKNCSPYRETSTLNVVLCVLGVCFLLLILAGLLWLYCKRRKKKPEKDQKIPEVRHVTSVSGNRPPTASRKKKKKKRKMKEKTEMITIM